MNSLRQGGALSAIVFVCAWLVNPHNISAQSLPSGWTSKDISAVGGSASSSSGTWTIRGSGANIWDTADGFQFAYRALTGDFDVSMRLTKFDTPNTWSKAGLMVRETLDANARNAYVMFSAGTGPALQYRAATGGLTTRIGGSAGQAVPIWLRLVRQGTKFTAYSSATGSSWTAIGSTTISLPSAVYVGLAVTARDAASIADATVTDLALAFGASAPDGAPTWNGADIGNPPRAGSYTLSSGTFSIAGSGADIYDSSDQFYFVYQPVQGDTEIIARVAGFQAVDSWSKVGVMIRQSLNAGSPHAFMMLNGIDRSAFQRRLITGGETYDTPGNSPTAPDWLRLVREGNVITAYDSTDGTTWRLLGSDTIAMSGTALVGLAITSHTSDSTATATLTNVSLRTPTAGTNQPPSVTLTAPATGATYTAPATISLTASASDADGAVSRVDFYRGSTLIASDTNSPYAATWSSAAAGTYALTAIAYDNEGASTTSPAVNVTVSASTNQPPTVSFTSPSAGATFTAPATIYIQASASDSDGTVSRVDLYQAGTLLKADFTSPYSFSWTNVPVGTYQLTATARDNTGLTRSTTMSVTVNPAGNQAPTASITSPAPGAGFTAPATVNIQASASDADGTIARVEFYRGTTLISTDTTSPYSASWTNASAGSYTLTARAYDNNGASQVSAGVNITIASANNQLPTVAITAPSSGATYTAPASMTIAATASDADGTISQVDFYVGTQLVASDTSSPYTASWTNVAAGTYSLTAVARDSGGATATSAAVSVTVSAASTRPATLVFNASGNHASAVTSYIVAIYRSVDPVTASPVATRDVGKPTPTNGEISVDISTLVNPLGAGSFYAVVRATGAGGTTASAPSSTFTN